MTASLFREEALRRFRRSPFQPPLLSKPVSGLLLAALSALAVVGMVLFAFSFQFARKEQATGYLTPVGGWSRVSVRNPAVVRQRFVEAGEVVEVGDVLFELTASEGLAKGQSVANRILRDIEGRRQALRERLAVTDAQYANDAVLLDADRTAAEREVEHLASELRSHEARLAIARRQYARVLRLRRSGAIAEVDLLAVADDVESRSVAVSAVLRELATVRTRLETHAERVRRLGHERDAERASAADRLHALAVEETKIGAEESGRLLAPRNGRIGSVRAQPGDSVRPGDVLLDIMPVDGELQAKLFVSAGAIGSVNLGQDVRIYLDAFPYERHGAQHGRVLAVSETAVPSRAWDVPVGADGYGATAFRIDVGFPGGFSLAPEHARSLRPGLTLSADIVRDYATLADWLTEPLRGAAGRL